MTRRFCTATIALLASASVAQALDMDWRGQFRAETHWLFGYSNGQLRPGTGDGGYSVFSTGNTPASFQGLFLDLSPRVIVNDNVSLHADLWLNTPDRGVFGGDSASASSSYGVSRAASIAVLANTFYGQVATDFGTLTVGRAPLHWGLGVIWNYDRSRFYRLPSTGDTLRMVTKLGSFRFAPAIVKYQMGSNYGGAFNSNTSASLAGDSSVTDYTLGLSYQNDDDQMEVGLLFLRRIAGQYAAITNPFSTNGTDQAGYTYNVWDFYAKKQSGIFTFAAEVPLVTGTIAGKDYSTVAAAAQIHAKLSDAWVVRLNGGLADGQENVAAGSQPTKFSAFSFHPDYRPGLIMFNYQLRNFSGSSSSTSNSPFNNPVTNARFLSLGVQNRSGKWSHELLGLFAIAATASDGVAGSLYFNSLDGHYRTNAGGPAQEKGLGFEVDYTLGYEWDEAMKIGLTFGLYAPGKFFEFSNSGTKNSLSTIFGSGLNLAVNF